MSEKSLSPPPTRPQPRPQDLVKAKETLRTEWHINTTTAHDIFTKLIELANTNHNITTDTTLTTRAKKKEWEIVKAAAIYLMDEFEAKHRNAIIEGIAEEVSAKIIETITDNNNNTNHNSGTVATMSNISMRLEQMLESKLEEITGSATSLKISDESALTQIIADRVQLTLSGPMGQLTHEAQAAFDTASKIVDKCEGMMDDIEQAKERIGNIAF